MLFPTIDFAIFFAVVFTVQWLLDPYAGPWKAFMVVASYVFYAWWDWRFIFLLAASTGIAYAGGTPRRTRPPGTRRKVVLWTTLALLLGLLVWFKYFGFVAVNVDNVTHALGLGRPVPLLTVTLPVGISFFTFMAISYVVDIYRGVLRAGPRHRRHRLPGLLPPPDRRAHRPGHRAAATDPLDAGPRGRPLRGGVLADLRRPGQEGRALVLPVGLRGRPGVRRPAPALRPRGPVRHLGLRRPDLRRLQRLHRHRHRTGPADGLPVPGQLQRPYTAIDLQDFWRRWHITLSFWLRDYLYIPLGGNRGSAVRVSFNILVTMLLGGLWHGASWTFVFWGAYHGVGPDHRPPAPGRARGRGPARRARGPGPGGLGPLRHLPGGLPRVALLPGRHPRQRVRHAQPAGGRLGRRRRW